MGLGLGKHSRVRASLMVAVIAVLVLGAISVARYYSTPARQELSQDDPRVAAVLENLRLDSTTGWLISRSVVRGVWMVSDGTGYRVEIGLQDKGYWWMLSVTFDKDGRPVARSAESWTSRSLPEFFGRVALTLLILLPLAGKIIPYTFGVKCPDCTSNAFLPTLTRAKDTVVYNGGYDATGDDLAAIVKREYICPACGYRKITYRIPEWYRPTGPLTVLRHSVMRVNPAMAETLDNLMDTWEEYVKRKARFKNYEEWRAYFEELKQSEREERP